MLIAALDDLIELVMLRSSPPAVGDADGDPQETGDAREDERLPPRLYGDEGIEQMRAVKRALDPEWKLSPGVLIARP